MPDHATPSSAAALERGGNLLERKRHRQDAEARQESPRRGKGEHFHTSQIIEAANGFDGCEMARVPRACAQPGDAPGLGVGFRPYPVQPPLVEQRGHVEPVAGGEREVAAEYGDVHRRPHRLVIRLRGVHDASLHRRGTIPRQAPTDPRSRARSPSRRSPPC